MAFFGLHNYSKPGPGVDKNGPQKKRFFWFFELYFRKFWKLIELNLLFILFCLPIVTIGPAIAGMTYVLRNYATEKPTFMFSDFFDAFKSNWKQGFCLSVILGAATFVCGISFFWYYANTARSWAMLLPTALCVFVCTALLFVHFYVYLMAVTVELKLKYILKNAMIFAFLGARTNLITGFFVLLITVPTILFFPYSFPVVLFFLFSTVGFITVFNSYPYIIKYIVEPHEEQMRKARGEDEEDEDEEPEEDDEVIFTDIGTAEVPQAPAGGKSHSKGKVIR